MTRSELVSFLKAKDFKEVDFNSNNAWGFGGARGKRYILNNITVTIARAGTRHQGEFPFIKASNALSKHFIDTTPNAKSYKKVMDYVSENLKVA